MCGVAGYFLDFPIGQENSRKMKSWILNRGPDHYGEVSFSESLKETQESLHYGKLMHARLAVNDLSAAANQPMKHIKDDIYIIFNGEIYDWQSHKENLQKAGELFKTNSDTEVILNGYRCWGIDKLLSKIDGMFAFIVLDQKNKKLYFARDRFGVKPLIYTLIGSNGIAFGSTFRSVAAFVKTLKKEILISEEAIDAYLTHRYIPDGKTIGVDINRAMPGFCYEWDIDRKKLSYTEYDVDGGDCSHSLDEVVSSSIKKTLSSDIDIAVYLSSGIDSTVVAEFANQQIPGQLKAITAKFKNEAYDESDMASKIARYIGLEHFSIEINPNLRNDIHDLISSMDDLFADPSAIPTWYLARESRGIARVVLTGDGGDELFGGYKRYRAHLRNRFVPHVFPKGVSALFGNYKTQKVMDELSEPWLNGYVNRFSGMAMTMRKLLYDQGKKLKYTYWNMPALNPNKRSVDNLVAIDFKNYLPEYILRKTDLCTSRFGVEARVPLLNKDVFTYVSEMSSRDRFKPGKESLAEISDACRSLGLSKAKKRGFNPPLREHLKTIQDLYEESIEKIGDRTCGLISEVSIQKLEKLGVFNDEHRWQLLVLSETLAQLNEL